MEQQGTGIFTGDKRHLLDDKNRLTIPSGWRTDAGVGASFLAVPQSDKAGNCYIAVLTPEKVAAIHAAAKLIPISDIPARQALTRFFSRAKDFTYDKQGRSAISLEHCQHAGIEREAVLVGALDNFFIYSPETWARVSKPVSDDNDTLARVGI